MKKSLDSDRTPAALFGLLLLVIAMPILGALTAEAADSQEAESPQMEAGTMPRCQAIAERQQQMQERMTAMNARLDDLVTQMNESSGDAKVDAVAAVVNELVSQRRRMSGMMMHRGSMMMRHMMTHQRRGEMGGTGAGWKSCPVFKAVQEEVEGDS